MKVVFDPEPGREREKSNKITGCILTNCLVCLLGHGILIDVELVFRVG